MGAAEAPVGPVASGENSPGLPVLPWGFTRACAMMCHDVPRSEEPGRFPADSHSVEGNHWHMIIHWKPLPLEIIIGKWITIGVYHYISIGNHWNMLEYLTQGNPGFFSKSTARRMRDLHSKHQGFTGTDQAGGGLI